MRPWRELVPTRFYHLSVLINGASFNKYREVNMSEKQSKTVSKEALIISEGVLKNKIYSIRGQKVMLDADLAEIYGYETKIFNRQVKRNIEKFEGEDFMFQLSWDEAKVLPRCQNGTLEKMESGYNFKYLPYAFTEQGIYMLMTVLRGELATKQSRALIRMFKQMKDYVLDNQEKLEYRSNLQLASKEIGDLQSIKKLNNDIIRIDNQISDINAKLNNTVTKSEISPILLDFKNGIVQKEFVIMGGELLRATEVYIDLYASAKKSIYLIDNYISIKTLRHFCKVRDGVEITVFSDNLGSYLHSSDLEDFKKEYPRINLNFIRSKNTIHDRFIILDYKEEDEKIYVCGASGKDAGKKLTTIYLFDDTRLVGIVYDEVEKLKTNPSLKLK